MGYTLYTCTKCGDDYIASIVLALGHNYSTEFVWAEDYSTCTLKLSCSRCTAKPEAECFVTSETAADGTIIYTASCVLEGVAYSDTRTVQPVKPETYMITWIVDGVSTVEEYELAAMPAYKGNTDKAADAQYTYTFTGWTPEIAVVTGDATYTATYTRTVRSYTITFVNDDGTVLDSQLASYGEIPVYTGDTPEKAADAQYTYTFAGWTPEITAVTGDATYTAFYTGSRIVVRVEDEHFEHGDYAIKVNGENVEAPDDIHLPNAGEAAGQEQSIVITPAAPSVNENGETIYGYAIEQVKVYANGEEIEGVQVVWNDQAANVTFAVAELGASEEIIYTFKVDTVPAVFDFHGVNEHENDSDDFDVREYNLINGLSEDKVYSAVVDEPALGGDAASVFYGLRNAGEQYSVEYLAREAGNTVVVAIDDITIGETVIPGKNFKVNLDAAWRDVEERVVPVSAGEAAKAAENAVLARTDEFDLTADAGIQQVYEFIAEYLRQKLADYGAHNFGEAAEGETGAKEHLRVSYMNNKWNIPATETDVIVYDDRSATTISAAENISVAEGYTEEDLRNALSAVVKAADGDVVENAAIEITWMGESAIGLKAGSYEITISYAGSDACKPSRASALLTVQKGEIAITSVSLSLMDRIHINFFGKFEGFNGIDPTKNGGMIIWHEAITESEATWANAIANENADVIEGMQVNANGMFYQQSNGVLARKYADEMYVRYYLKLADGNYVYSQLVEYSVQKCCQSIYKNSNKQTYRDVASALLHYGAAAQHYFDYNLDDLANAVAEREISFDPAWLTPAVELSEGDVLFQASEKVQAMGASLSLVDALCMNIIFNYEGDYQSAQLLAWDDANEPLTATNYDAAFDLNKDTAANRFWGQTAGVIAREYGKTRYYAACFTDAEGNQHFSKVIALSPEKMADIVLNKGGSSNPEFHALCKAMVTYGECVQKYFADK